MEEKNEEMNEEKKLRLKRFFELAEENSDILRGIGEIQADMGELSDKCKRGLNIVAKNLKEMKTL